MWKKWLFIGEKALQIFEMRSTLDCDNFCAYNPTAKHRHFFFHYHLNTSKMVFNPTQFRNKNSVLGLVMVGCTCMQKVWVDWNILQFNPIALQATDCKHFLQSIMIFRQSNFSPKRAKHSLQAGLNFPQTGYLEDSMNMRNQSFHNI